MATSSPGGVNNTGSRCLVHYNCSRPYHAVIPMPNTNWSYQKSIPFSGDTATAMNTVLQVLLTNGFALVSRTPEAITLTGPGLNSTRQNPVLGATRILIKHTGGTLSLDAELGGVQYMSRFITYFPIAMMIGFSILFGGGMGLLFGMQFGVGFGVPFARGWNWLSFIGPIVLLPLAPWLLLSFTLVRSIRSRTCNALDSLLTTASVLGQFERT